MSHTPIDPWKPISDAERQHLETIVSRLSRHQGKLPDAVYCRRTANGVVWIYAMQYLEPGRYERWGLRQMLGHNGDGEIQATWSTIAKWLRELIGDRPAIEVYPRDGEVVNTAPTRWFWVLPHEHTPPQYNLIVPVRDPNAAEHDTRFCPNCGVDTPQVVHCPDHERDGSSEYRRCLACDWEYSGMTGKYHPPSR